ncbi:MAG TPA: hypothetical protein PK379_03020 [Candidatus Hydrogenedentes bacterium]|nr:hypothetical protein [Candidatus Hydrogenedentota bacterium]HOK88977.1 hypothetical protein [Candidatus Hydrogenedentota bacterium]
MVNEELLKILVCPETRQPVHLADASLVERVNSAIRSGGLKNRAGQVIEEPAHELLVREDGLIAYPVRDDIPVMLIDEGIPLDQLG